MNAHAHTIQIIWKVPGYHNMYGFLAFTWTIYAFMDEQKSERVQKRFIVVLFCLFVGFAIATASLSKNVYTGLCWYSKYSAIRNKYKCWNYEIVTGMKGKQTKYNWISTGNRQILGHRKSSDVQILIAFKTITPNYK